MEWMPMKKSDGLVLFFQGDSWYAMALFEFLFVNILTLLFQKKNT